MGGGVRSAPHRFAVPYLTMLHSLLLSLALLVGVPYPTPLGDLAVRDFAGTAAPLRDLGTHEVVVVNFWAVWCPPCRDELPWLLDLHEAGVLQLVAVNVGDREGDVARFLSAEGLEALPVRFVAPRALAGVDVPGLPTTYVLVRGRPPIVHFGPLTPVHLRAYLPEDP
jgi:cytochrome c biogenesis protein CcmG, thiol:disulfide interchange protein DsbE